jgi:Fe-S oxidoreductase
VPGLEHRQAAQPQAAERELDWTNGLDFEVAVVGDRIPDDVEWLFWVGCAASLDDRARRTTRAIASVLHAADVKFAVLGPRESCTGDPARRMGNEYLFQELLGRLVAEGHLVPQHPLTAKLTYHDQP